MINFPCFGEWAYLSTFKAPCGDRLIDYSADDEHLTLPAVTYVASALGTPLPSDRSHLHALWQLLKALRDGFDVRGCYWWTLMDK